MNSKSASILATNGGLSSIKFEVYEAGKPLKRGLHGTVDRIGFSGTNLTFHDVYRTTCAKLASVGLTN